MLYRLLDCIQTSYYRHKTQHLVICLPTQSTNSTSYNTQVVRASVVHMTSSDGNITQAILFCAYLFYLF